MSLRGPPRRTASAHPLSGVDPAFAYASGPVLPPVGQCGSTGEVKLPIQAILEVGRREGYGVTKNVNPTPNVGCGAPMDHEEDYTLSDLVRSFEKAKNGLEPGVGSTPTSADAAIFHSHSKLVTGDGLFGGTDVGFGGPVSIGVNPSDGNGDGPSMTDRLMHFGGAVTAVKDKMTGHINDALSGLTSRVAVAMSDAGKSVPPGMGATLLPVAEDGTDTEDSSSDDDDSPARRDARRRNERVDDAVNEAARAGSDPDIAPHAAAASEAVLGGGGAGSAHVTVATSAHAHSSAMADLNLAGAAATTIHTFVRPDGVSADKWSAFTDSLIDVATAVGQLNSAAHKKKALELWNLVGKELQLKITARRYEMHAETAPSKNASAGNSLFAETYKFLAAAHARMRRRNTVHSKSYVTSLAALQGTDLNKNQRDVDRLLTNIGAGWKKVKATASKTWQSVQDAHVDLVAQQHLDGLWALYNDQRLLRKVHLLAGNLTDPAGKAIEMATTHLMTESDAAERSEVVTDAHRDAQDDD